MIGHCQSLATSVSNERGHAAWQAAHMMGVDDPRAAQRPQQAWRERVGRMPAQPPKRAQGADAQSTIFVRYPALATKRDQLAFDLARQCPRQLERVALPTAE